MDQQDKDKAVKYQNRGFIILIALLAISVVVTLLVR